MPRELIVSFMANEDGLAGQIRRFQRGFDAAIGTSGIVYANDARQATHRICEKLVRQTLIIVSFQHFGNLQIAVVIIDAIAEATDPLRMCSVA